MKGRTRRFYVRWERGPRCLVRSQLDVLGRQKSQDHPPLIFCNHLELSKKLHKSIFSSQAWNIRMTNKKKKILIWVTNEGAMKMMKKWNAIKVGIVATPSSPTSILARTLSLVLATDKHHLCCTIHKKIKCEVYKV